MGKYFIKYAKLKNQERVEDASLLTGSAALATRGIQNLKPREDRVQITYGYKKNQGGGHKSLANEYKKLLDSRGIKSDVYHSSSKLDWVKNWLKAPQHTARIDTGFGIPTIFKSQGVRDRVHDFNPDVKTPLPFQYQTNKLEYTPGALAKELNLPGKKIITLGAGESGYALEEKVKLTQRALAGRQDVQYVVLGGNRGKELSKHFSGDSSVTVKGYIPKKDYQRYLASSDLNIGYTGSSSISEQLANKNPSVILSTLVKKSRKTPAGQNLEWAEKHWNLPTFTRAEQGDYAKTLTNLLDTPDLEALNSRQAAYTKAAKQSQDEFFKTLSKSSRKTAFGKGVAGVGLLAGAGYLASRAFTPRESDFPVNKE